MTRAHLRRRRAGAVDEDGEGWIRIDVESPRRVERSDAWTVGGRTGEDALEGDGRRTRGRGGRVTEVSSSSGAEADEGVGRAGGGARDAGWRARRRRRRRRRGRARRR